MMKFLKTEYDCINTELYTIPILKLCDFERICSKYCYKNSRRVHNKKNISFLYIL